jgi:membrane-associated phospholipid phosphatase
VLSPLSNDLTCLAQKYTEDSSWQAGVQSTTRPSLLLTGLLSLLLFLLVTGLVFSGITQAFDAQLAVAINNAYLGAGPSQLMVLASEFGREYFWVPVVGVMLLAGNRETKLLAIELAALFVVGIVAGEILKFIAYRQRPYETVANIVRRLPADSDSSYPSGHALIVSIGAALCLIRFRSKLLASLLALEAAVVCYSRIYLGMHYPLDVIGGVFLGLAIVGLGLFVFERYLDHVIRRLGEIAERVFRRGPLQL